MSIAHRIAVLGFSDFERKTLASYFRLATNRDPHYELVQMCSDGDFVVADADHGASVQLVVATERLPETVFVGTHAPAGAVAWLPRPIDPLHVMRELDRLVAAAVPRPTPAPGSPGVVTVIQPYRRSTAPVPTHAPSERAGDAVRDEIDDELRDELLDTRPATFQIQPDIPVPMPAPAAPPPGRAGPAARAPRPPARRTPRQPALTKPPPPRPPTLVERAVAGAERGMPEGGDPAADAGSVPAPAPASAHDPAAPTAAPAPGPAPTPAPESALAPAAASTPDPVPAAAPAHASSPVAATQPAAATTPAASARLAPAADGAPGSAPAPASPAERGELPPSAEAPSGASEDRLVAEAPSASGLSLTLVDVPAAAPPPPVVAPRDPANASPGIVLPPPSALLVDDSEVALRFLQTRLEPWGLQVERASGSRRALELLAQRDYDFVFLDVELGDDSELDGLALCQHIKRHQGTGAGAALATSVIMVSAHHSQLDRVRGTLAGCDAFLGKPLQEAELHRLLQRHGLKRMPAAREAIDLP